MWEVVVYFSLNRIQCCGSSHLAVLFHYCIVGNIRGVQISFFSFSVYQNENLTHESAGDGTERNLDPTKISCYTVFAKQAIEIKDQKCLASYTIHEQVLPFCDFIPTRFLNV